MIGTYHSVPALGRARWALALRAVAHAKLQPCCDKAPLYRASCYCTRASCCTCTSSVRSQAVSCVLLGDPIATRTPSHDREPEFSVMTENRSVASCPHA